MTVRAQPSMSPGHSARVAEVMTLSDLAFRGRVRNKDTEEAKEDESLDTDDERERSEGQQQAVQVVNTVMDEPLGLGYEAARRRALESNEDIAPSTYEVGQSSMFVPEHEGAERIYAFRQPTLATWVDPEDGRVYTNILTYAPPVAPV
ncbi:hypothetical protein Tco_0249724 [Tanacetum coccineum]